MRSLAVKLQGGKGENAIWRYLTLFESMGVCVLSLVQGSELGGSQVCLQIVKISSQFFSFEIS